MTEPSRAPLLVVGAHRSGTTLLRTMLAAHPALLVHRDEPQFFLGLARRYGHVLDRDSGIDFVLDHPYHEPSVTRETLVKELPEGPLSLRLLAQTYLREWKKGAGAPSNARFVLKQPHFVFHLDLVLDLFPGALIVNMVRDPRANVASQMARWPRMSLWTAIAWWRGAIRAADGFSRSSPEQILSIRYEDLVLAPEETLTSLCRWLELPYSQSMLRFDMKTRAFDLSAPGAAAPVHYSRPEPDRLRQWKEHMAPASVRLIERLCCDEMDRWGYERAQPQAPLPAIAVRALVESIRWGAARITGLVERARQSGAA